MSDNWLGTTSHTRYIPVLLSQIRRDGDTQVRVSLNQLVVTQYAQLMAEGTEFPPIRVWFDEVHYWLSDGFHRVAAAESSGIAHLNAEVLRGTLSAARWDSYRSNATHGLRRTRADIEFLISRAIMHPYCHSLSNREIARHLNIPESTLRRWRGKVAAPNGADGNRVVTRGDSCYSMSINGIGQKRRSDSGSGLERLRGEIENIRLLASPPARSIIGLFGNLIFDRIPATVCLDRLEEILRSRT